MPPARRRVSYIIPPPTEPVPHLQLPPHGASKTGSPAPLLLPVRTDSHTIAFDAPPRWAQHPRHRLGVSCLTLDTSTQLVGRASPEGILYSGGRDGLVISWDLGISMKRRERRYGLWEDTLRRPVGSWEIMTGWADEVGDEDTEDGEDMRSDGDVLGEVYNNGGRKRRRRPKPEDGIPYEEQWETDMAAFQPGKTSQFRQSVQAHTDWVNDIILCNNNQTLVSGSSDGTVKAWSPHSHTYAEPSTVGMHADYVRCLAYCRDRQWLASGSFDRTIKLWDPTRTLQEPLATLHAPEASGPKASVYALTTDPFGSIVAAGSPERVVRMWDPRSGKRVGKLVGHTDNIRAILISEDARYLLTGSADASIKLWSLASQKCLHTFTHHTDSVWSLHSSHPSLEIFYSGDRTGFVCKVDVEGCTDVSEGECILIAQDADRGSTSTEGINKIVAMDDNVLWTASGASNIKRWRVPTRRAIRANVYTSNSEENLSPSDSPRQSHRRSTSLSAIQRRYDHIHAHSQSPSPSPRSRRHRTSVSISSPITDPSNSSLTVQDTELDREGDETWYGIPFDSLVKLTSPNETFSTLGSLGGMSRGRDPEIATLYSAASVMSVPRLVRSPLHSVFSTGNSGVPPRSTSPVLAESVHLSSRAPPEETLHPRRTARAEFEEREIASDAVPLHSMPDETIHGDCGLVRCALLNDRVHALTVDTAGGVAVWDIVRGTCLGRFSCEDIAEASFCGSSGSGSGSGGRETDRSPREAIETVRERIEGEAVVAVWANIDTKTGLLGVHLNDRCFEAEIYADEAGFGPDRHFSDETRINIGKWVLRNLFIHFIRDQQRTFVRRAKDAANHEHHRLHRGAAPAHIDIVKTSPELRPRSSSEASRKSSLHLHTRSSSVVVTAPNMLPAAPPASAPLTRSSPLMTPMIPINTGLRDSTLSPIPQSPLSNDATPVPRRSATMDYGAPASREGDYFSLRTRRPSVSIPVTSPGSAVVPPSPDDFGGWGAPGVKPYDPNAPAPTTPGGLMGRLKAFGKGTKRANTDLGPMTPSATAAAEAATPSDASQHSPPKTPFQALMSSPLNLPSSTEAPSVAIPPHTSILISEECLSGWTTLYRGQVSTTGVDARTLEEVMPFWLLEYLLMNKVPPTPTIKVPFVLLPYRSKDPNEEQLPELLNTAQSKLTASRFLRVRKLTHHVQDKLDKIAAATNSHVTTPRSSVDARSLASVGKASPRADHDSHRPRPEELFEILCNDMLLPLDMTLASVRQFVWRNTTELVMHYRRKVTVTGDDQVQVHRNGHVGGHTSRNGDAVERQHGVHVQEDSVAPTDVLSDSEAHAV